MDLERAMEFQLEQQAASQARFDAQMAEMNRVIAETQEIGRQTRLELRRAVRLGVQEARAERRRRKEADDRLAEADARLAAGQEALQKSLQALIDSMRQGGNGRHNS